MITDDLIAKINKILDECKFDEESISFKADEKVQELLSNENVEFDNCYVGEFDSPGLDMQGVVYSFIKDNKPYSIGFTMYSY